MSVSVIVPAFNAAETIEECVRAILELEPAPAELIVVDDASTDDTAARAEAAGARVVRLPRNQGPGLARNAGAQAASGEFLAFTDADCVVSPDWLAPHLEALSDSRWCATTGPYSGSSSDGVVPQLMDLALRFSQRQMPESIDSAISSNFCVRRSDFLAVGGFPEYRLPLARRSYWGNEDQELAHLLVRHTGRPVRWVSEAGPRHAYRATLRGHLGQQAKYAESVVVSHARFPSMLRTRSNYSKGDGAARLLTTWLAVPALAFPPAALLAVPFLAVHAPAVRFVVASEQRSLRRLLLAGTSYPFMFLTSAAWTAGLISGAVKGAAGLVAWSSEEAR